MVVSHECLTLPQRIHFFEVYQKRILIWIQLLASAWFIPTSAAFQQNIVSALLVFRWIYVDCNEALPGDDEVKDLTASQFHRGCSQGARIHRRSSFLSNGVRWVLGNYIQRCLHKWELEAERAAHGSPHQLMKQGDCLKHDTILNSPNTERNVFTAKLFGTYGILLMNSTKLNCAVSNLKQ